MSYETDDDEGFAFLIIFPVAILFVMVVVVAMVSLFSDLPTDDSLPDNYQEVPMNQQPNE